MKKTKITTLSLGLFQTTLLLASLQLSNAVASEYTELTVNCRMTGTWVDFDHLSPSRLPGHIDFSVKMIIDEELRLKRVVQTFGEGLNTPILETAFLDISTAYPDYGFDRFIGFDFNRPAVTPTILSKLGASGPLPEYASASLGFHPVLDNSRQRFTRLESVPAQLKNSGPNGLQYKLFLSCRN